LTEPAQATDIHLPEESRSADVAAQQPHPIQHSRLVTGAPVYYGWVILIAGTIGYIMSSPGQTYSVSIFIEHFIADLGISRSLVSTLYTIGTFTAGMAMPFIGRQVDQRGPRVVVGVISALFALGCIYMGFVRNAVMLGFGFLMIRMLGQGGLSLVSGNVINQWWVRRRGLMLGIAGVVASLLGSGLFPSFVHNLIGRLGWRSSYQALGLMVAVVMLPVGILFYRSRPEDYGLLPDGAKQSEGDGRRDLPAIVEENWGRSEAVRTSAFWIISLGLASISMLGTGLQFHMVSIFEDRGLSAGLAAGAFMSIAVTNAIVRIISGVLVDRVEARYLLFVALLGQTAGLLIAPRLQGASTAWIYGAVLGITSSLQATVATVVWAKYFGRLHLGSITGVASLIGVAASALGPMPMGIARDLFGSYTLALTVLAAIPLALGAVVLTSRRPVRRDLARPTV
jgi:MFS transporter, OFA family, oxalate/formate antiporter